MSESRPESPTTRRLVGCVALFGLCYVGYVKGVPVLARVPVDLTVLAGAVTAGAVGAALLGRRPFDGRVVAGVLGLWALFGIGAVMTVGTGHGGPKIALLYTLTLVCALGPCFLLATPRAQRLWLHLSVAVGVAMVAAAVVLRDMASWTEFNRLNLAGTNTIGTGRVIGAAAVVATIMLALAPGRRWWWAAVAVVCTGAVVMVGSRGPVLSLLVAVLVALFLGRVPLSRRATALSVGGVIIAASVWFVIESSLRHPKRIEQLFTGELTDAGREDFLREALSAIARHPLGVGWEGFSFLPGILTNYGGRPLYPHNLVVEIFLEGGWLAGAATLVLAVLSIRGYILNSRTAESVAMLGLGVYWFAVAQTSSDINGNRMTWAMLVLGLMYYFQARDGRRAEQPVDGPRRAEHGRVSQPALF
jgi:O-antigen ligase